jgi:N-acetylglucosaminyl-diphospho-decaprenol L-rhamnosyltransferase
MRVALITVTFNSKKDLLRHWAGASALEAQWIVVDNASSDGSADIAARLGARVVRLDRNVGFSAANNIGAKHADADCLIFVNPDVEVTDDGARGLAAIAMESRGLVAPQLLNDDGSPQENGRTDPYLYRKILHFFGSKASGASYEVTAGAEDVVPVSWVIGAAVAIPIAVFRAIGGWDDRYFIYYEDSDICLRARALGFRTKLAGTVRWKHGWGRATRRQLSWFAWRNEFRSAWLFYTRYPRFLLHPYLFRAVGASTSREGTCPEY